MNIHRENMSSHRVQATERTEHGSSPTYNPHTAGGQTRTTPRENMSNSPHELTVKNLA